MAVSDEVDVIVAGAGPVGLVAALLLDDAGFSVLLAGPPAGQDRRTTALMQPAIKLLGAIGVDVRMINSAAPLRTMRILDGTRRLFRSPPAIFNASEIDEAEFGWNVTNSGLTGALHEALALRLRIRHLPRPVDSWSLEEDVARARFDDGSSVAARLVAAADGRNSLARAAANIATRRLPMSQSALVLNFVHSRPHGNVSTEFHTEWGPCTQVPLEGRRSSLVWVNRPREAERLSRLDDETLSRAVETRLASILGKVTVEPGRQVFALSSCLPARFAARRVMLLGEAAHIFPPIGAQGMNLGLRDAADLIAVVKAHADDPGKPAALDHYDRKRRRDIAARAGAVNMLNDSLLSSFIPTQALRSFGMSAIGQFAPLRTFFMREGMRPGSGFAALLGRSVPARTVP